MHKPKMGEHVGKRLARMRVRREQGKVHKGMTSGKPDEIGARIATGADNPDLDFLPSRVRRHGLRPLALRELEAAACFCLAVFLTLHDARVAGQEAFFFQNGTKSRLEIRQGLRKTMAYRAGLTGKAAASDGHDDIVLARAVSGHKRLLQDHLKHWPREIRLVILIVHGDLALLRA